MQRHVNYCKESQLLSRELKLKIGAISSLHFLFVVYFPDNYSSFLAISFRTISPNKMFTKCQVKRLVIVRKQPASQNPNLFSFN